MNDRKPTVLDQLTSPTISPDILLTRIQYWKRVADRNERHGRVAQANRLRMNCRAMAHQARELKRGVASVIAPTPGVRTAPPATAIATIGKEHRARASFRSYSDFQAAYLTAKLAVHAAYGDQWYLAPHACIKARVPPSWVRCTILGRPSSTPRDLNFPIAEFWPDRALPVGPHYAEPDPGLRPRFKMTSLVSGEIVELYAIEIPGWMAQQEIIAARTMTQPCISDDNAEAM